jgi:uncharacterized protein YegL
MADYIDFTSDNINVFMFLIDKSNSMAGNEDEIKKGIENFVRSFENFEESSSLAVSICFFSDYMEFEEFKKIEEIQIDYYTDGGTWLNTAIVEAHKKLKKYMKKVVKATNVIPRMTFVLLSDGEAYGDELPYECGKEEIEEMNYAGITTAFVAFGEAISSEYGKKMGFMANIDTDDLVSFFGVELSESCKEQSKSYVSLGSNFFSQVGKSSTYSNTTAQALDDDDWFNQM